MFSLLGQVLEKFLGQIKVNSMKKSVWYILFFLFVSNWSCLAEVQLQLGFNSDDIELAIENSSDRELISPYFKREVSPLILVFFQDGSLLKDRFWSVPGLATNSIANPNGRVLPIRPNSTLCCTLGFHLKDGRFSFNKIGSYYIVCLVKGGNKLKDVFFVSNFISLFFENSKFISKGKLKESELPDGIKASYAKEMEILAREEK